MLSNTESSFKTLYYYRVVYVCMRAYIHICTRMLMWGQRTTCEIQFSLHHVGSGIKLRLSGLSSKCSSPEPSSLHTGSRAAHGSTLALLCATMDLAIPLTSKPHTCEAGEVNGAYLYIPLVYNL